MLALVAGAFGATAGCSAFGDDPSGDGARTVAADLRGTPTATPSPTPPPTPTPTPAPYVGSGAALDRPRDVTLTNQRLDDARVAVRIRDGATAVLETTETVPGAGGIALPAVIGGAGTYDVRVRTDDGRERAFAWTADADAGDLGVDLETGLTVRDRYRGNAALDLVGSDTAGLVGGGWGSYHPLIVDNGGPARSVTLALANGEGSAGVGIDLPGGSRITLPLAVRAREVEVVATVDGAERGHEWRPPSDDALYVDAAGPRFLCDLLRRDLRVVNRTTDANRSMTVRLTGDGDRLFAGEFRLAPGETAVRKAVVGPAGDYGVEAESGGDTARYDWEMCPPVGPVVVAVGDDGITAGVTPTRPTA